MFIIVSLWVVSLRYSFADKQIDQESVDVLRADTEWGLGLQESNFERYVDGGMEFIPDPYLDDDPAKPETLINDITTSQVLDYMMVSIANRTENGWDKIPLFARAFEDEMRQYLPDIDVGRPPEVQSTYVVAALSVAFDQDFRQEFRDINFPVDYAMFEEFRNVIYDYISST